MARNMIASASSSNVRLLRAPTARNMIARGKREARRPWSSGNNLNGALKERNIDINYFALSELHRPFGILPGATRFALAPAFHITRLWRSLLISQRNQRIDFRSSARGNIASDQSHYRQHCCQDTVGHDICWSNAEQ